MKGLWGVPQKFDDQKPSTQFVPLSIMEHDQRHDLEAKGDTSKPENKGVQYFGMPKDRYYKPPGQYVVLEVDNSVFGK